MYFRGVFQRTGPVSRECGWAAGFPSPARILWSSLPRTCLRSLPMLLNIILVVLYFIILGYAAYRFWCLDKEDREEDMDQ